MSHLIALIHASPHLDTRSSETKVRFPDEKPRALVRMQKEHWDPLFAWAEKELGVKLKLADGFAPAQQDQESIDKLRQIVEGFDIWQLAGRSRAKLSESPLTIQHSRGQCTLQNRS